MSINDVSNLFTFAGGLGMFLYGMRIMGDGMQKTAGSKMNHFLGMVTNNRLLGVALGALITAILHSSAATTVMVVGFVNAGILNLTQAVGVIMGANIGTTITAWMVSLNQLGDAFTVLQPAFFAPLCIGIGTFLIVFSKRQKNNLIGEIVIGVGLLFVGLEFMSNAINPYTDAPIFAKAFAVMGAQSDSGHYHRRPCYGSSSKLYGIRRYPADAGDERCCYNGGGHLHNPRTEHRNLPYRHAFQCRGQPDGKEGGGNPSDL